MPARLILIYSFGVPARLYTSVGSNAVHRVADQMHFYFSITGIQNR